jgi:hypothetical protein
MEQIRINKDVFEVLERRTPEEAAQTMPAVAYYMVDKGIKTLLVIKKPRGKKLYYAYVMGGGYVPVERAR